MTQRRFCVLTTGRTGSTALMNRLQRFDDPKPPTSARDYVTNREEFEAFIRKAYRQLRSRRAPGSGE